MPRIGVPGFANGQWHHVVGVKHQTGQRLYANGALITECTATFGMNDIPAPLIIGSMGATYANGQIDDVRIYNRALSADDVALLYRSFPGERPCNADYEAVMWFNHDEGVMQYCNGTDWISIAKSAPPPFNPRLANCTLNAGGPFAPLAPSVAAVNSTGLATDENYVYVVLPSGGVAISAYTFNGSTWNQVGSYGGLGDNRTAIWEQDGYIYVTTATDGLTVLTFDGSTFAEITNFPGVFEDVWSDGDYIYTIQRGTGGVVRAFNFDGATLSELSSYTFPITFGVDPQSIIGYKGAIFIQSRTHAALLRFDGVNFSEINTTGIFPGGLSEQKLAADSQYLYHERFGNFDIKEFDGSSWSNVASPVLSGGNVQSIWTDGDIVYIGMSGGLVHAGRFDGVWQLIDTMLVPGAIMNTQIWSDGKYVYAGSSSTDQVYALSGFACRAPRDGCTSPTGKAGEMNYNLAHAVLQYCDGNNWVNMGPASAEGGVDATTLDACQTGPIGTRCTSDNAIYAGEVGGANPGTNDGTVTGTDFDTDRVAGVSGGAMNFDGVDDFITFGDAGLPAGNSPRTISYWFRLGEDGRASVSYGTISAGNRLEVHAHSDLDLVLVDVFLHNYAFPWEFDDRWYHLAVVFPDGASLSNEFLAYLDGKELSGGYTRLGSVQSVNTILSNGIIGRNLDASALSDGLIDDVRIYNRALSAAEVATLYATTGGGAAPITGCPNIGDFCDDGTVYVGPSPDGNVPMYTLPTQLPGTKKFADVVVATNSINVASLDNCSGMADACRTGEHNTNVLANEDVSTESPGIQASPAVLACYCLGETHSDAPDADVPAECSGDPQGTNSLDGFGHDDWYLPAIAELDELYSNLISPSDPDNPTWQDGVTGMSAIGDGPNDGVLAAAYSGNFFSSSETSTNNHAWGIRFSDGYTHVWARSLNFSVACVRKGHLGGSVGGACSNPRGVAGDLTYNDDFNVLQFCNGREWIRAQ